MFTSTILNTITSLALLAGPAVAAAMPAADNSAPPALEARVWRSNVDVAEACRLQYNGNYAPVQVGNRCNGWKCDVDGQQRGINMDVYCVSKFGGDAYASCHDEIMTGVWNWQCHDRT